MLNRVAIVVVVRFKDFPCMFDNLWCLPLFSVLLKNIPGNVHIGNSASVNLSVTGVFSAKQAKRNITKATNGDSLNYMVSRKQTSHRVINAKSFEFAINEEPQLFFEIFKNPSRPGKWTKCLTCTLSILFIRNEGGRIEDPEGFLMNLAVEEQYYEDDTLHAKTKSNAKENKRITEKVSGTVL
uniref:Calpain_III domain-containing protein n=1 Tax=Heterorhabditis bacteriophora TaxID=37862 RepID=A0A1I7XL40_HETBA